MPTPDPIAFTIFGFDIRWYGILISGAIIIAVLLGCKRAPKHGLTADDVLSVVIFAVPSAIIGARLYYVIFEWDYYSSDLSEIFNFRGGGLAIHGGLIGAAIAIIIVCKVKNFNILECLDLAVPFIALGQAIGRWGNYFNSEAHGGPTDLPWAITVNGQSVHPTFLYESLWCFALFIFLIIMDNHRKFLGETLCLYGILYSVERIFVEALRTDSLMIGPFKQAQVISICIIPVCIVLFFVFRKKYPGGLKKQ